MKKGRTLHSVLTLKDLQKLSNLFVVTLTFVPPPAPTAKIDLYFTVVQKKDNIKGKNTIVTK